VITLSAIIIILLITSLVLIGEKNRIIDNDNRIIAEKNLTIDELNSKLTQISGILTQISGIVNDNKYEEIAQSDLKLMYRQDFDDFLNRLKEALK
jgi:hypothetical protein